MAAIAEQLQQFATALSDPTRGTILTELDRAGELTATQLAHRLNLTPNNVYHHMRVLSQLGVVGAPRIVPGPTYVEKYYQITPEVRAAMRLDQEWYDRVLSSMSVEDQKAAIVAMCLTMSLLLRQAARDYERLDADSFVQTVREDGLLMLSFNQMGREQFRHRLEAVRHALDDEHREYAEDTGPRHDLMIIAGLPALPPRDEPPE